ncbi:MAG: HupE/UreJ family protein, partial [Cyanobacteria bacterium J06638_38]
KNQASLILLAIISAIAGIFHGYAYGESIVGAETTALGAYLLGFCGIQLAISAIAYFCGRKIVNQSSKSTLLPRFAGLIISGIGFALVSNLILI